MTIAAVYARVSTEEQAREGLSLREQQRLAFERAGHDSRAIGSEHVYVEARSGKIADRPEYQRMLADAAAGAFETLYVWKFDRLGRDAEELLRARRMLEAAGVTIVSLTEGLAESTLVYGVRALVSQEEREKVSERTRMGLAVVMREGRWKGGTTPYGYRPGTAYRGELVIDEAEAAIVRRIDSLYTAGQGAPKISIALNADNVPTRYGRKWTKVQVLGILDNPIYVGLIRTGNQLFDGRHEPIRTDATWQEIQAIRNGRRSSGNGGRGAQPARHLLTRGMLRCVCGQRMSCRTFRGEYDYYLCRGRENGTCDMPTLRRDAVDGPLLAMFETHVLNVEETIAHIRGEADRQIAEARRFAAVAETEVAKIDAALARVRADYLAGEITAAEWRQLQQTLNDDRAAAFAELDRHTSRAAELESDSARLDAEREFAGRIAEIRQLVAGQIAESGTVDAIRAALVATFDRFDIVATAEGHVAVPRIRADRRIEIPRTPDELLIPAKRVALAAREETSGAQLCLPHSLTAALFAAIPLDLKAVAK